VGVFGEKLRKQREQRGIELDAISNTTKISTRMLRALEDEQFDQLPGGVFNKGFVRAYARQIGLNEEEAVADYLAALRESQIQQQSILPDFRSSGIRPNPPVAPQPRENAVAAKSPRNDDVDEDTQEEANQEDRVTRAQNKDFSPSIIPATQPRERFPQKYPAGSPGETAVQSSAPVPWGKLALTLLVITAALALWNFRRHAHAQPTPASQPLASTQAPPAKAPAQRSTQTSASTNSPADKPASSESSLSAKSVSPRAVSSSAPAALAAPTPTFTPNAKLPPSPQPEIKSPAVHATTQVAAVKPPPPFTLLIRAEETTWISLAADGKPIARETLIAPAHTSIRATREIVVRAGNSAGISFVLNGKEIPAQGNEGEVRTYTFDATGLQTIQTTTQPQSPAANR
jgi:cytoskeleton protein RodZ